jgi:stage II sporulation protein D
VQPIYELGEQKQMKKTIMLWMVLWASALVFVSVLIPGILVKRTAQGTLPDMLMTPQVELDVGEEPLLIPVYLSRKQRIEEVPLEHYVRGVLAAEMPIEFELEAMKAQAIAARTYIMRRIVERDFSNVPVEGAWVTDTVTHQAYLTTEQLKENWGVLAYTRNMGKVNQAVNETKGLIATYANKPIDATFFSTSNGYTENSEDYWSAEIPYLRSVPSPWDQELSPKFETTVSLPYQTVYQKLGITRVQPVSTNSAEHPLAFTILETTEGHRIKKVSIGSQTFTGREVREKLGLNSSQFKWKQEGDHIKLTTYGYGHGVGMSQWGAHGMAQEGSKAEDIIKHYYQGVEIERVHEPFESGI